MFRLNAYSYDKLIFNKAVDRTMTTAGAGSTDISNGVVTIKIDAAASGTADGTIVAAVTAKINAVFGVPPNQLADHVMYCLPPGTSGSWIAYAYINGQLSVYNDGWCNSLSGQMRKCESMLLLYMDVF